MLPDSWEKRIDEIKYTDSTPYYQNTIKEMVRAMMRLLHNKGILSNAQLKTFFDDIIPKIPGTVDSDIVPEKKNKKSK